MSKEIGNKEYRANTIRKILEQLHAGRSVDALKQQFKEAFDGVSASEIAEAERTLIAQGMPVSEVQKLCDLHAAVVGGSVEQIHESKADAAKQPGHPVHTLLAENRAIEALIETRIRPYINTLLDGSADYATLTADLTALYQIDKHYSKKENLLFPYLEKHGITAPPKVMWGVDDEIRALIKQTSAMVKEDAPADNIKASLEQSLEKIGEMIFKEENILVPMTMEAFSPSEWQHIADESGEIGFCLIDAPPKWQPAEPAAQAVQQAAPTGSITLPTGVLTPNEITRIFDTLPVDITFVGSDDTVRYFSQGAERVFARTKAIIGRKVTDCHPPASVHIVEGIVSDFKSGKKDHEDFWIRMGDKYVFIRYFAVRDENGAYMGTVEVTQDIAPIQQISGEKRLVT